jgi:micrococcal nuclease
MERTGKTREPRLLAAALVALLSAAGCGQGAAPRLARSPLGTAGPGDAATLTVKGVVDGDTAILEDGRSVRYLGIDAPEVDEPGYREARGENQRLAAGKTVRLEVYPAGEADHYGRLLGVLRAQDGSAMCINVELVRRGAAWVYRRSADSVPSGLLLELLEAQAQALKGRLGIWKRLDGGQASVPRLVSTRLRLHRLGCQHVASARPHPVLSLEAELLAGKSPCRNCKPLMN